MRGIYTWKSRDFDFDSLCQAPFVFAMRAELALNECHSSKSVNYPTYLRFG